MRKYLQIAGFLFMAYAIYALLFASNPMTYTIYFPNEDGTHLVGTDGFENIEGLELYNYVVSQLIRGPEDESLYNPIPKGTRLLPFGDDLGPIVVDEDTKIAMVNFSKELVENHPGGSTGETMTIASIVNTLTSFRDIEKVEIYVEGELLDTLAGHMDLDQPLEEFSDLIK
jgi:spore germination protein GerM